MKNIDEAITTLHEIRNYMNTYLGIGEIYGVLGHDIGGVLEHSVLHNDPCCQSYKNGELVTCTLEGDNLRNVKSVYEDMKRIRDVGTVGKYYDKILGIIELMEKMKNMEKMMNMVDTKVEKENDYAIG